MARGDGLVHQGVQPGQSIRETEHEHPILTWLPSLNRYSISHIYPNRCDAKTIFLNNELICETRLIELTD